MKIGGNRRLRNFLKPYNLDKGIYQKNSEQYNIQKAIDGKYRSKGERYRTFAAKFYRD